MKFTALALLIASSALTCVKAHSKVFGIWINGVDQGFGEGSYIRSPPTNNPVRDLTSSDVTCNANPSVVPKTLSVRAGDTITFEWHHEGRSAGDQIIDPSHKGPILVYIAPTNTQGKGTVWVKLFEENYVSGSWAVDKLIASRGLHSIVIPELAAGDYLLRPEILGLHEADSLHSQNPARGVQLFHECVQIKITSSGALNLPSGIALPGEYKDSSPGIQFDLYSGSGKFPSYKAPGGQVWSGAAGGAIGMNVTPKPTTAVSTTTPASPATTTTTAQQTPTTTSTTPKPTTTVVANPAPNVAQQWQQCGGNGYTGPTTCAAGLNCHRYHEWYSQCLTPSV